MGRLLKWINNGQNQTIYTYIYIYIYILISIKQTVDYLTNLTETEQMRKQALCEVFDETQKYAHSVREVDQAAVQEIAEIFPEIIKKLKIEKVKVKDEKAPVLVLGK